MGALGLKTEAVEEKINIIRELFRGKKVVVSLSGGVDSSTITALAKSFADQVIAVTADSATYTTHELEEAQRVAEEIGVRHIIIKSDELENPAFKRNPPDRCYHCKKELIKSLRDIAEREECDLIVEGTNASDLVGHRPGLRALREGGIVSPFIEAGITKDEIREIARSIELSVAEKPSMACLSSRFPYGTEIDEERLKRVERAEEIVRELTGVRVLRVRDHGNLAKIEVGRDERTKFFHPSLMDQVVKELKSLGYLYITLDLNGYRTGAMDETLKKA